MSTYKTRASVPEVCKPDWTGLDKAKQYRPTEPETFDRIRQE